MVNLFLYTIPVIIFVIGLFMILIGRSKKNSLLKVIGIGMIVCFIILESPSMIQGFMDGFIEGYND